MASDFGPGTSAVPQQTMMNGVSNPTSQFSTNAKAGAAEAMEFQLWVSQQAHSLSKLKVFQEMAKKVNDS